MKPTYRNVLSALAEAGGWVSDRDLPDGNGRKGCVRQNVLSQMRRDGLILSNTLGEMYRITEAGLTRLQLDVR